MTGLWDAFASLVDPQYAYYWECDLPECDGSPHEGRPYSHARTKQRFPDTGWFIWLLLLGRGWGKTRTGAENFLDMVLASPRDTAGKVTNWIIAGPTYADTRDTMVEGPAGLLEALEERGLTEENGGVQYDRSPGKGRITLRTGQRIYMKGGDSPKFGVGGNIAGAWLDEFGLWKRADVAWKQGIQKALRQSLPNGAKNRALVTTTPRAAYKVAFLQLKAWLERTDGSVFVTRGGTMENAHNLTPEYLEEILKDTPPGTRAYREEILGELVEDVIGALWTAEMIANAQVDRIPEDVKVVRRLLTIDPAATSGPNSDETGMHLLAKTMQPHRTKENIKEPHVYVEKDLSMRAPAPQWAKVAILTAVEWNADILYEMDNGGEAWKDILQGVARELGVPCPRIRTVRARNEGSKATRANPVVARYYEGRVHHVKTGNLVMTEEQMTTWVPEQSDKSPDRVDSVVHGVNDLMKVQATQTVGSAW